MTTVRGTRLVCTFLEVFTQIFPLYRNFLEPLTSVLPNKFLAASFRMIEGHSHARPPIHVSRNAIFKGLQDFDFLFKLFQEYDCKIRSCQTLVASPTSLQHWDRPSVDDVVSVSGEFASF